MRLGHFIPFSVKEKGSKLSKMCELTRKLDFLTRARTSFFAKHKTIKLGFGKFTWKLGYVAEFAWKLGYSVCKRIK